MNSFSCLRHQLIYLKKNASFKITSSHNTIIKTYIQDWIAKGLPFIYTRQTLDNNSINIALTVLINDDKCRVSLRISKNAIKQEESLPNINKLFPSLVQPVGVYNQIHVYGSFLFQYLTNQPFVTQDSDLDILFVYKNNSLLEIKALLDTLSWTSKKSIDGEVRFYGETEVMDVSIKELLMDSETLLVKTIKDTYLLPREALYETYPLLCS